MTAEEWIIATSTTTAKKRLRIAFPIMPGSVFNKSARPCRTMVRGGSYAITPSRKYCLQVDKK
jgi:hypothetical protein